MTELVIPALETEWEAWDQSNWAISLMDHNGECPFWPKQVPSPPFVNVSRVWVNVTGTWVGLRFLRDNEICLEATWTDPPHPIVTKRSDLTVRILSCYIGG